MYNAAILSTKPSESTDLLVAARQDYQDALKTRDVDKLLSLVDPEAVWMPPNDTTLYGAAEVGEWWKEYFDYFRITSIAEPENEVMISGEFAIEQSNYMIAISPIKGGQRIRDDGRMLRIWKRQPDQSWKMWRVMWNSIRPVGSGTSRYMARLLQKKDK